MKMFKKYKPTSPGRRFLTTISREGLWKGKPERSLSERLKSHAGRDNTGRISVRHRQAPLRKRIYRKINFNRSERLDLVAKVERIEYDPNRTSRIALLKYEDGTKEYIICPDGLSDGDSVCSYSGEPDIAPGNCAKLADIPVGTTIHCIAMRIGGKALLVRSAGTFAKILGRNKEYTIIRMGSGEVRMIHSECRATIGTVSNKAHVNRSFGKAGRMRWHGRRPSVRGTAMNPIDHPHGGGEGRTRGKHPVSPTGKPAKGGITRRNKRSNVFIVEKRKRGRR